MAGWTTGKTRGQTSICYTGFRFFTPRRRCRSSLFDSFLFPSTLLMLCLFHRRPPPPNAPLSTVQSSPVHCRLLLAPEYTKKKRIERKKKERKTLSPSMVKLTTRAWPSFRLPSLTPGHCLRISMYKVISADFIYNTRKDQKKSNTNEKNEPIASWNRRRKERVRVQPGRTLSTPESTRTIGFKGREKKWRGKFGVF